ncbi:amidohydrolase/deacetylase family metallohydrolase [Azospirillum sp. YIM DDC1]|uniref:Amidohydrolase/deacetylase family metallohydrolase n=1 Tax=Azospirillum aestuarii TaxID=2802052 RepID=A0ABS1I1Z6_9PROT|nr:amidohydrolase/deacetylase family metallohydrolase [Azospirillum aestuarii]MBK3776067.1 amidohydrolase/deacetylase family metallohydrolase [Azospirillum brasilense]MBK4721081.1 amidohydrolase/deacetylase family metallohydrolase [Azospirillum aestuarii]
MSETHTFDLVLRGGRILDPANGLDLVGDLAVAKGRIAAVAERLPDDAADTILDVSGKLVTPGLIDTHAHVFEKVTGRFGLNPDMVGVRSGVSTLVDQGGPSLMTLPAFRRFIAEPARSRTLCFLSAYLVGGLEGHYYPQLYRPDCVDVDATIRVGRENRDIVKGIKAHAEVGGASRWGLDVIKQAKRIADGIGVPLYVHLGQLWPEVEGGEAVDPDMLVEELVPLLDSRDILAHPFTRHPGGFISTRTGEVHPVIYKALERGLTVDVGHGSHFSFEMARRTLAAGILPYTLGADLHGYNVKAPVMGAGGDREANPFYGVAPFSLTHAMTELLTLGMALGDVLKTVTSNPAAMLGMADEIGALTPGMAADVAVLEVKAGRWQLSDNSGERVTAPEMIVPAFSLRDGAVQEVDSPLLPKPIPVAA